MPAYDLTKNFYTKGPYTFLKIFLLLDIIFIFGHVIIALFFDYEFRSLLVDTERGFPELFQYIKYLMISCLAIYMVIAKRSFNFIPWALLFLLFILDDAFRFHETSGEYLAEYFDIDPAFGLRAVDLGELIYAASLGVLLISVLTFSYIKGNQFYRKTCLDISLLFGFFLFFGIGIDMVHQWLEDVHIVSAVVALIEDGGEMLTLSLMIWYFYFSTSSSDYKRPYLIDFIFKGREIKLLGVDSEYNNQPSQYNANTTGVEQFSS